MSSRIESETNNRNNANDGRPTKRKRVITEKRREQNRQAQKNHREKQKRHLRELASLVVPSWTSQTSGTLPNLPGSSTGIQDVLDNGSIDSKSIEGGGELLSVDHGMILGYEPNSVPGAEMSLDMLSSEAQSDTGLDRLIAQKYPSPISLQDSLNPDSVDLSWLPAHGEHPHAADPPTVAESHPSSLQKACNDFQGLSSDFTYQDGSCTSSMQSQAFSASSDEPSPDNINQIIAENRISMEDIIFTGLESITQRFKKSSTSTNPHTSPFNNDRSTSVRQLQESTCSPSYNPSPSITHLPLRQMALMAACLANAAHIGVDVYEHIRRPVGHSNGNHTISPFFQPALADTTLTPTTIALLYQSTIPDLRPCAAQIKQSHFLYIDTFPLPEFRKRILALRSCVTECEDGEEGSEKVFDEEELCRDIDSDGIVCWGSDAKVRTGAPWDRRSWEMRPWFLKKWWMVTGGLDGEMGKQSRWWADMRGEIFDEG